MLLILLFGALSLPINAKGFVYKNSEEVASFTAVPFLLSRHSAEPVRNASLVFWNAATGPCDRTPMYHGTDLAKGFSFVFQGYVPESSWTPPGWEALANFNGESSTPQYETDLFLTEDETPHIRIDIFPEETNPYHSRGFLTIAVLNAGILGLLSVLKLYFCGIRLYSHLTAEFKLTYAVQVLAIESVSSVFTAILAVDPLGLFGIHRIGLYYFLVNSSGILGFISTFLIAKTFNGSLHRAKKKMKKNVYLSMLLTLACVLPVIDYLGVGLRLIYTSSFVHSLNALVVASFQFLFARAFYKAKKQTVELLKEDIEQRTSNYKKQVLRMSRYLYYASFAMGFTVLNLLELGVVVTTGSGKATSLSLEMFLISGAAVGCIQVLSIPLKN